DEYARNLWPTPTEDNEDVKPNIAELDRAIKGEPADGHVSIKREGRDETVLATVKQEPDRSGEGNGAVSDEWRQMFSGLEMAQQDVKSGARVKEEVATSAASAERALRIGFQGVFFLKFEGRVSRATSIHAERRARRLASSLRGTASPSCPVDHENGYDRQLKYENANPTASPYLLPSQRDVNLGLDRTGYHDSSRDPRKRDLVPESVHSLKGFLWGTGLEMGLYGIHFSLFVASCAAMAHRPPRTLFLPITTALIFTFATLGIITNRVAYMQKVLSLSGRPSVGWYSSLAIVQVIGNRITVVHTILGACVVGMIDSRRYYKDVRIDHGSRFLPRVGQAMLLLIESGAIYIAFWVNMSVQNAEVVYRWCCCLLPVGGHYAEYRGTVFRRYDYKAYH
ncbi:hypothetical protein HDZ31DRAFT_76865, partial [Schizophyllum fasciatum]